MVQQKFNNRGRNQGRRKFVRLTDKEREERVKQQAAQVLEDWKPKTKLGKLVKDKKITDIDEALKHKILEAEIVDSLLNLNSEILNIGQAKGKFGGGKRRAWRQTQRKTKEGNVPTFSCMCVIGDGNGYVRNALSSDARWHNDGRL